MSSPPRPFFFSFFLSSPFSCLTAPQAFSRPDRVLSQAGARRCCQGWPLFSGHTLRVPPAFTAIEHDGRLDGSGRLRSRLLFVPLRVSAHYSDGGCLFFFGRPCYEVHGACDNRINLYPAAPMRLAKVLLAWTIAQEGWGSSFERQIGCQFAKETYSHTSDLPDTPEWGVGTQRAHC